MEKRALRILVCGSAFGCATGRQYIRRGIPGYGRLYKVWQPVISFAWLAAGWGSLLFFCHLFSSSSPSGSQHISVGISCVVIARWFLDTPVFDRQATNGPVMFFPFTIFLPSTQYPLPVGFTCLPSRSLEAGMGQLYYCILCPKEEALLFPLSCVWFSSKVAKGRQQDVRDGTGNEVEERTGSEGVRKFIIGKARGQHQQRFVHRWNEWDNDY